MNRAVAAVALFCLGLPAPLLADDNTVGELEQRVEDLRAQLEAAQQALASARATQEKPESSTPTEQIAQAQPQEEPADGSFRIGPLSIGGAVRVNYVYGSYTGYDDGPSRGGHGGNVELDTYRINLSLDYNKLIGKLEYRWYPAGSGVNYNFMHTGWLGYQFDEDSHLEVGLNRVPFGPGPYGVSQSWFFDQHYYVGLADDMDLGLKYVTSAGDWDLDVAYYARSERSFSGRSKDSARYGYDAVLWTESVDDDGSVAYGGAVNGYEERDQFNLRAIYHLTVNQSGGIAYSTDIGASLQYGKLQGKGSDDGNHWAASAHMVNKLGNVTLATQLTRYEFDIGSDNTWQSDGLIPLGAYDFAWPVATQAWLPAISLSYKLTTEAIPWLDYVLPYIEWSSIIKDEGDFNDSQLFMLGAAWARGGWYIYSDLAYSTGNYFIGNKGDNYSSIDGVGDFGVTGNDQWNYRLNLNFGYYY